MELAAAIHLMEPGISRQEGEQVWADLGAGSGLFTKALSTLIQRGTVHAIDRDAKALRQVATGSTKVSVKTMVRDFTSENMGLHDLQGILMANSLHYVQDKIPFLKKLKASLRPEGRVIIVEYDMDKSNLWVPYPLRFSALESLAVGAGFTTVKKLATYVSMYNSRAGMYSALLM